MGRAALPRVRKIDDPVERWPGSGDAPVLTVRTGAWMLDVIFPRPRFVGMPGATPEERIHHDRRVLQQGEADYYVRPYYMSTDPSEVQGPTDKQQV